jgi:hypothetical protein
MYIVDGEQMVRLLKLMTGLNVFCFVTRTIVSKDFGKWPHYHCGLNWQMKLVKIALVEPLLTLAV